MQMRPDFVRIRINVLSILHTLGKPFFQLKQSKIALKVQTLFIDRAPRSLANRILVLQFAWAIVIYILVIAALWFATNLVIESSVRHQGEGWISKLDELGIPIYASDDPSQLNDAISYVHNFPEVLRAQYLDVSGEKITSGYTRKGIVISKFSPLSDKAIRQLEQTDNTQKPIRYEKGSNSQMRVSAPIWIKSIENDGMIDFSLKKKGGEKVETIGFIDVVIDYSEISTALNRNLAYASMLIAVIMVIAAFIGRVMIRWALNPLSDLEEPLTRLANGETDVTVKSTGDREIARIGIALNTTISALKERDEALRRMANHDGLTGLVNRKYFVEELEKEVERIANKGGTSALFFFDLDRFKYINDTYGHAAGDRLLIQIAEQLTQRTRDKDLVGRFGGDEFTLLAYHANHTSAQEIAESFMKLMHDFVFYEAGDMLKIHFSIGVTIIEAGSYTSQDYLKEADAAVHEAKAHGRNCYRIYQRTHENITHESGTGWHQRLQDVLDNEQTIIYYQPVIGLKNQSEKIWEVLLRLPDAEQKFITPGSFMPTAERFGLMAEFDRQVIKKVAAVLLQKKIPDLYFSINLSEQFVGNTEITEFLQSSIIDMQISPKHIIFELSEQLIIRNLDKLRITIPALSKMGFRIAIDDFGAGFCSFNYIKQLPVHFLKISNSLIENINTDNIDRITVSSIVEIATDLNMQTIAKFAADAASITLLTQLGVDFVQGNFTGQAAPEI
jgi:diguanylate cyclase (GGDEF)-like protein